jgi:Protein of unknown function (DUF3106)
VVKAAVTIASLICGLMLALLVPGAAAQQPSADDVAIKSARPLWSELSPKQQAVLAPLAAEWDSLDTTRRKKWVTIANRYPRMTADEQQRLQSRMRDWASLTPAQRRVARENYQSLKQLPRAERGEARQRWYQNQQPGTPNPQAAPAAENAAPGK